MTPGLIDGHVHVTAFSAELRDLEHAASSYVHAHSARIMREMLGRVLADIGEHLEQVIQAGAVVHRRV